MWVDPSFFDLACSIVCELNCQDHLNVEVLFIESVCDDDLLIEKNIRECKLFSPDYVGKPADEGTIDYRMCVRFFFVMDTRLFCTIFL